MECVRKLLEKIMAKCINNDIEHFHLLPITQFGSRLHHSTIDMVATLVHKIQSTCATGHVGALLLFDISGFFDNINPGHMVQILHNKGFPTNVCTWALSFLTGQMASLKIGIFNSEPFLILNGTPQGSPLSPILSALYTSSLIKVSAQWEYCDLLVYVDDGAIYAISAITKATAAWATEHYAKVLKWLDNTRLQADPSKMELMIFNPRCQRSNLIGAHIHGTRYTDPNLGPSCITTVTHLRYLGVYIDHRLDWTCHVMIMVNRARSNICGVNLLGNSVYGLDFLNWRKVYNVLIIPGLTYSAQVWYTGTRQKGPL
jgi:Reverse transcriptase (RNA-dependent DNA polymerase)